MNPDLIVTAAYGQFIPKEILDFPKYGCINVHASLLPLLRGGAPIQKQLLKVTKNWNYYYGNDPENGCRRYFKSKGNRNYC